MSLVNQILRGVFDLLLFPFRTMPAIIGILVVSLLTAIGMLVAFKATSNQEALAEVKRKIHAGLFEIRLFNDDFRAIVRAQLDILRHNLSYLRLSLVPMIFILPPLVLVVAQLQFHYGYQGLQPGDDSILELRLTEGWEETEQVPRAPESGKPLVELELPPGVRQATPSVWIPDDRTLSWRLEIEEAGDHVIGIRVGDRRLDKAAPGRGPIERRSPVRPARSFLDQLIYPAEPPLPEESPVEEIRLTLEPAAVWLPGWTVPEMMGVPAWMILFFALSVVFAFALRKPMGVEI
ncbi:MAG: hypothetical protein R3234_00565 [Thermoanaerobaculia bacterium]|nr:hypothetical protein [Thermoanaerobaculia bacterium]